MSRLGNLVKELCPDGVEYKKLGDCCTFKRGTGITKKAVTYGTIPVVAGGQKPAYYHNEANRFGESITVSGSGAYAGFVMYWDEPIFVSDAFTVHPDKRYSAKFIYYILKGKQNAIHSLKRGGGVPHVHGSDIAPFKIPIPPLPVQEEIVRILDNFTELTAELTAELIARKKQYEHYLNAIIKPSKDSTTKWVSFGDIVEQNLGGGTPSKANPAYWGGSIPWVSVKDIVREGMYVNSSSDAITPEGLNSSPANMIPKGWLILCTRINPGLCSIANCNVAINQDLRGISFTDDVLVKYIYYYFKTLTIIGKGTTVKGISVEELNRIKIPVPPLEEQERIVAILDRFDALCNDLTSGLPAEIEARRKQYEYYRDKLLTFKEAGA